MKQTDLTGYGTMGCRIELNHADMIALGVEVDVIKDFLHSLKTDPETKIAIQERMAINRIVFFLEKFAIIPSETNVFTDSPLDFKKTEQPKVEQSEDYFKLSITVIPKEQSKELRNAKEYNVNFIVAKAMEVSAPHLSPVEIHNYILGNLADEDRVSWDMKTEEDFKRAIEILDKYGVKYKTSGIFVPSQMVKVLKLKGSKALRSKDFDETTTAVEPVPEDYSV